MNTEEIIDFTDIGKLMLRYVCATEFTNYYCHFLDLIS